MPNSIFESFNTFSGIIFLSIYEECVNDCLKYLISLILGIDILYLFNTSKISCSSISLFSRLYGIGNISSPILKPSTK